MNNDDEIPNEIFLQTHDEEGYLVPDICDCTWHPDRVFDTDEIYIHETKIKELEKYKKAWEKLRFNAEFCAEEGDPVPYFTMQDLEEEFKIKRINN